MVVYIFGFVNVVRKVVGDLGIIFCSIINKVRNFYLFVVNILKFNLWRFWILEKFLEGFYIVVDVGNGVGGFFVVS